MSNPQQLRGCIVLFSEAETARVKRLIVREGSIARAMTRLGVSAHTMHAARDCGRMQRSTKERILATLDRLEAS